MSFCWNRAKTIGQKEIYHVLRDPFTLTLALGIPVIMIFVFGFAIEFNVKYLPLAVHDDDHTQFSRRLTEIFGSSDYFIIKPSSTIENARQAIMGNRARAALIIPGNFQNDLFSGRNASVQILLDGSDNSTVTPILSYLSTIQKLAAKQLANFDPPEYVSLKTRFLFNPELNSKWFVIPGLLVTVMAILSLLLTSLTIASEWENGSMELLLSTPVEPLEIIIGKIIPYAILGLAAVTFVFVMSRTIFAIPFRGSLFIFGAGCILFLLTYLAQGLFISMIIRVPAIAMQIAMLTGLLPATLLSGFIFPIESMPIFFQYFTMLMPARWFMAIARQLYLKGSNLSDLSIPFLALGILCAFMVILAVKNFKKDLEP